MKEVKINGEYIKLDQFLKLVDEAGSGGEAKVRILSGEIRVNGETESRRGRKLRSGDQVSIAGSSYRII